MDTNNEFDQIISFLETLPLSELKALAQRNDLSLHTLTKIRYRKTTNPRYLTVLAIKKEMERCGVAIQ